MDVFRHRHLAAARLAVAVDGARTLVQASLTAQFRSAFHGGDTRRFHGLREIRAGFGQARFCGVGQCARHLVNAFFQFIQSYEQLLARLFARTRRIEHGHGKTGDGAKSQTREPTSPGRRLFRGLSHDCPPSPAIALATALPYGTR